jgi:hypothetical protein
MGARNAIDSDAQTLPLRQTVSEIVNRDLKLSANQSKAIEAIEHKYYDKRSSLRMQIADANRNLADALMADMAWPRAQRASNQLEQGWENSAGHILCMESPRCAQSRAANGLRPQVQSNCHSRHEL